MKARLLSGASPLALWAAMPARNPERDKALTEAAHKLVDAIKLERKAIKEHADG